jgi:hypothetical protein
MSAEKWPGFSVFVFCEVRRAAHALQTSLWSVPRWGYHPKDGCRNHRSTLPLSVHEGLPHGSPFSHLYIPYCERGTVQRDVNGTHAALYVPQNTTALRTTLIAADFQFEPIWLPLIAEGCGCRNLRTLAAVFVRHRSLLVVRAAVKVAVKSRSDPRVAGHLWGTLLAATMHYDKLHSRRSDRQALRRREQRLQSGPTLWEETA